MIRKTFLKYALLCFVMINQVLYLRRYRLNTNEYSELWKTKLHYTRCLLSSIYSVNKRYKSFIMATQNFWVFIGCRWLNIYPLALPLLLRLAQNLKKIGKGFDPILRNNILYICENCNNKVYINFIYASNGERIMLHFHEIRE